jgi:hypothetical protein
LRKRRAHGTLIAVWTSLEIAKLIVGAATPVVVLLIGFVINRAARRVEEAQWANRKLIERRLDLYEEMAPGLNDLYCFFHLVGNFRDVTPPEAVRRKRALDKAFYINEFLMGPEFQSRYHDFMNACFKTFSGTAQDAKVRSSVALQRQERQGWDPEWEGCFVARDEETPADVVGQRYEALMKTFAAAIGVRSAR